MKKKGLIKFSFYMSTVIILLAVLFLLLNINAISGAEVIDRDKYYLGEEVSINLESFNDYSIKIITPKETYRKEGNSGIIKFSPEDIGIYKIEIITEEELLSYKFNIVETQEALEELNIEIGDETKENNELEEAIEDAEEKEEIIEEENKEVINEEIIEGEINSGDIETEDDEGIVIGEEVIWKEEFTLEQEMEKIKIKIPESAENITIKKYTEETGETEEIGYEIKKSLMDTLVKVVNEEVRDREIIIENIEGDIEVEYVTEAPKAEEKNINEDKKEVVVSSPEDLHYKNVKAYTTLPKQTKYKEEIKVYWKEQKINLGFEAYDTNDDGFYDYVEWIIPHLSEQNFEIIIINKAEHLNSTYGLINDAYDLVSVKDEEFIKINSGEYLRVVFEKNLTSKNDITIYARGNKNSGEETSVEVYEKNSQNKIADFGKIKNYDMHKIFLNNFSGSQNTFDLKVISNDENNNGWVEFDYVIDPYVNTSLVDESYESTSPYYYEATGNWTRSGTASTAWDRSTGDQQCGSAAAHVDGNSGGTDPTATTYITLDGGLANLTDASTAYVTFLWRCDTQFDNNDFFSYDEYYSGSWNNDVYSYNLGGCTGSDWSNYSRQLPAGALQEDFTVRFAVEADATNEDFFLDCFDITREDLGNEAPNDIIPNINTSTGKNQSSEDMNCFSILSDDNANTMNVTVRWYKNDVLNISYDYNNTYANGTLFTGNLSGGNFSEGGNWSCALRVYDGDLYSSENISVNLTVLAPNITINAPTGLIRDVTPLLNISISAEAQTVWYSINGGPNRILCNDCNGEKTEYLYLEESAYTINIYANISSGEQNNNLGSFTIDFNNSYDDTYTDNSSINIFNNITAEIGNISFTSPGKKPELKTVYSGTSSMTGATLDVNIPSIIDINKSFLTFSHTINDAGPSQFLVRGRITNTSNIEFSRIGTGGTVEIAWYVSEFNNGVDVQRNTITQQGTVNTAITSVNTSNTFPLVSFENVGSTFGSDDGVRARITSPTNLETYAVSALDDPLNYQVISYPTAKIQNGSFTQSGGTTTSTVNINGVDLSKAFIISTNTYSGNVGADDAGLLTNFTNSTQIRFERDGSTADIYIGWYVVEFTGAEEVQSGVANMDGGTTELDITINEINTSKSIAILSDNQKGGKGTETTDNPGTTWYTANITNSTNLHLTRALTGSDTSNVQWYIIEFDNTPSDLGTKANFTSYQINLTKNVSSVSNVTWNEENTDTNNNLTIQLSADGGQNWSTANNGEALSSIAEGTYLLYRVLFSGEDPKTITLLDLALNWTNTATSVPEIGINYPLQDTEIKDVTPMLNITINYTATKVKYTTNNGLTNTTLCNECTGEQTTYLHLPEGNHTITAYASNSIGIENSSNVSFSIDMDKNNYDDFNDNSSIYRINNATWNQGNITCELGMGNKTSINIALVCGSASCGDANKDQPVHAYMLNNLGYTITNQSATTFDTSPYDAIVISESVNSGDTAWLKSETVGILTIEGANNDEFDIGTGGSSDGGGDDDINITNNTHYITRVFPEGILRATTGTTNLGYVSGLSNDVIGLGYYETSPTLYKLVYVEDGGTLTDATIAAERRAFFGAQYFNNLNSNGTTLFIRALDWVAYNTELQAACNMTAQTINVTQSIKEITNITWNETGTGGTNNITIELSADGGQTWAQAINGQNFSGFTEGDVIIYRILFYQNLTSNQTIYDINFSWSEPPDIDIIYPQTIRYFRLVEDVNYTLDVAPGFTIDSCWWTNDSGIVNYSMPCGQNLTGMNSTEGNNTWKLYANDSGGSEGWESITFTVDRTAPNLTIINLTDSEDELITTNNLLEEGENLTIYVNVTDENVDSVWIVVWQTVKGGAEMFRTLFTYLGGVLWKAVITTDHDWDIQNYNYTIYANDTGNWTNETEGNFSIIKMNITINLSSITIPPLDNVTLTGHINLTNTTYVGDQPINIILGTEYQLLANLTANGIYNNYQNKTDTSSTEFNKGIYMNTTTDGENITFTGNYTTANYTKVLDAGARVEWEAVIWNVYYPTCSQEILTFQEGDSNGYSSTEDTYIRSDTASSNYGTSEELVLDTAPDTYRSLIKFESIFGTGTNQIPYNSTINEANISVTIHNTGNDMNIYEILEDWDEAQATYNNRLTGTAWGSTGLAGSPSRSTILEDTGIAGTAGQINISILNAFRRWNNETSINYGVVLDPTGGGDVRMRSSEYTTTQTERPELMVNFTGSGCVETKVYVRNSNDLSTWTSWQEVDTGEIITDSGLAYRYLEYKVDMERTDTSLTPYFQDFEANYTAIVTNASGSYDYNITAPSDGGNHLINVNTYLRTIFGNASINLTVTGKPSRPILNALQNNSYVSAVYELNWTNSTDYEGDPIYYILEVDNNTDFSSPEHYNATIAETISPTGDDTVNNTITEGGTYYWRVRAYDLVSGNSSWSDIWQFTIDASPPVLIFHNQTDEEERIVNDTNALDMGENLTIQVNVTDPNLESVWVVVWQTVKGGAELVRTLFTYLGGVLWKAVITTDHSWDLEEYNYTIYANDSVGFETEYNNTFRMVGMNITLSLNPQTLNVSDNVTANGLLNYTNGTYLFEYPINIWMNGTLLLLRNLTAQGIYNNNQNKTDTNSGEFDKGIYTHTNTITDEENITLEGNNVSGNYTKILDAGAMVEWDGVGWQNIGASCSGTMTFQEGDSRSYSSTEDTYVDSNNPITNYGGYEYLNADGNNPVARSIIKFNNIIGYEENNIPPNSTINEANITLQVYDTGDVVTVYEVLENWTEAQTTYNNRLTGTAWSSAGVAGSPSRSTTTEDTFTAGTAGAYSIDITNAFSRWNNETSTNYGFVLHPGGNNNVLTRSSEYTTTQTERPLLWVNYTATECTSTTVYIRLSNDKTTWTSWQQVSDGNTITDNDIPYRYLEYRVDLKTTNNTVKPALTEFYANYTAIVTNSTGGYAYNFSSPSTFGNYLITVNTSYRTMVAEAQKILWIQLGVSPEVTLITPSTGTWYSEGNITLVFNASDLNDDIRNATLIINGLPNATNATTIINSEYNNFTINFTSSGQYNWTVNVTDSNNNVATDAERIFYIDLEDPNVTLIWPGNNTSYSISELNLSFNATDNMDSVLSCDVYLDGSNLGPLAANNGAATNVSTGTLSNGAHYWNVTCTDEAGRKFTSEERQFNVSDSPPTVNLVWPLINYTSPFADIGFVFNATDNSGFENCTLILNDQYDQGNQTEINNAQNTTINKTGLTEGNYNWTINCIDLSLNEDQPAARNFSVDLYNPTVILNEPINLTNYTTSTVHFNFTVNDTFDQNLECEIVVDGDPLDSGFIASNGSLINRIIGNLTDGAREWYATCWDDANHINSSEIRIVNVLEPPQIVLNTTNASSYQINDLNLSYIPTDNTNLSQCNLYIDGIYNQSNITEIINGQQNNFSVYDLGDGEHSWFVNCTDYANLAGTSEIFTLYIDAQPPTTILHQPNGTQVYQYNISFNFTVIDAVDQTLVCNLSIDGDVDDPNFNATNGTVTQRNLTGITDGYHTWDVSCIDSAGNNASSETLNFTKFTAPEVYLVNPDNNYWHNTSYFNLTYFTGDDEGIANTSLIINGQVNLTNQTTIQNYSNNTYVVTDFPDGEYNWTVNSTDITGFIGTTTWRKFYVDTQMPEITLNYPNGSEGIITTNNITFNFTPTDNLDSSISCDLYLQGSVEYAANITNGTNELVSIPSPDGNYTWNVTCWDDAENYNTSRIANFTIIAPPNVTLNYPPTGHRNLTENYTFIYTPQDPIGIHNCTLYIDDQQNDTDTSIAENQQNNFTVYNIPEGNHNWTVSCTDPDSNTFTPNIRTFIRDISPPSIFLNAIAENVTIDKNSEPITFNWTAVDLLDSILQCNLTIASVDEAPNVWVTSNASHTEGVSGLNLGINYWNVTCWDQLRNTNTSFTRWFNLTLPDFMVNESSIVFNVTTYTEGETIRINATVYNLKNVSSESISVRFYEGDPDSGGTPIGANQVIDLAEYGQETVGVDYTLDIGDVEIYVMVDPPTATNGSFVEANETNNKASRNVSVGAWHYLYGSISTLSQYKLEDSDDGGLISWDTTNFEKGNIYVTDSEATISWTEVYAIGKNYSGADASVNDFTEIDNLLSMTAYQDSVYNYFTNSGTPKNETNITSFNRDVREIPVADSINNSNFLTGILWDASDDAGGSGDGEFTQADAEDLIFFAKINKSSPGAYGTYDYEMRIPATLREYNPADSNSVIFYIELY